MLAYYRALRHFAHDLIRARQHVLPPGAHFIGVTAGPNRHGITAGRRVPGEHGRALRAVGRRAAAGALVYSRRAGDIRHTRLFKEAHLRLFGGLLRGYAHRFGSIGLGLARSPVYYFFAVKIKDGVLTAKQIALSNETRFQAREIALAGAG